MEIEIEIFWHSNETLSLDKSGVDYSLLECDTSNRTFYSINAISPYYDEKSEQHFCKIYYNGDNCIATKSYEEIKQLIHEANTLTL